MIEITSLLDELEDAIASGTAERRVLVLRRVTDLFINRPGEIWVETARIPVGKMAAMKPEPLAFTSLASRIGSPATKGTRAIQPERSSMAAGREFLRMKFPVAALAGHDCH